jgi:hypothetical protein
MSVTGHFRHCRLKPQCLACPLRPRKRPSTFKICSVVKGHVWTAPSWQGFFYECSIGRSSHVFGLEVRFT